MSKKIHSSLSEGLNRLTVRGDRRTRRNSVLVLQTAKTAVLPEENKLFIKLVGKVEDVV